MVVTWGECAWVPTAKADLRSPRSRFFTEAFYGETTVNCGDWLALFLVSSLYCSISTQHFTETGPLLILRLSSSTLLSMSMSLF